jgi:hypothetical protein
LRWVVSSQYGFSNSRARAGEIIVARDEWHKTREQKQPRRLLTAERKRDKASDHMMELEEQIAEMPATSIAEMVAKARRARASDENCYPDCDDRLSIFSASIVRGPASMFGMN